MLGIRMRNDSWRRTSREVLATSGIRWPRSSLKYFLNPRRTRGYGRDSLNNGRQQLRLRKKSEIFANWPFTEEKKFPGPDLRSLTVQMGHTHLQVPGNQAAHCNKSNYPETSRVFRLQVKLTYHPDGGCSEVSVLNNEGFF